ncbi:MAG: hypothetical protein A2283_06145 [Lentisphaerae bacterium RIFOXYA12_FULL_48_11]|nr:MAG: hypothetical protein A2283_06145 [Lentisphaerae bacterium RIFOXYA12_FULL_48_11]
MTMIRTCPICRSKRLKRHVTFKANAWTCSGNPTYNFNTVPGNVDLANGIFQENYELITDTNDGHKAGESFSGPSHTREVED